MGWQLSPLLGDRLTVVIVAKGQDDSFDCYGLWNVFIVARGCADSCHRYFGPGEHVSSLLGSVQTNFIVARGCADSCHRY